MHPEIYPLDELEFENNSVANDMRDAIPDLAGYDLHPRLLAACGKLHRDTAHA